MLPHRKQCVGVLVLVIALALSACQARQTPEPTQDLDAIRTEVALTAEAALTGTALAQPTATVTNTPQPTATSRPSPTITTSASGPTPTRLVVSTGTPSHGSVPDKGQWIYNTPNDGATFYPGQEFDVTWRVRNIGNSDWTTKYMFRYFLSDPLLRLGAADIYLPKDVPAGDEVDISLHFKAPTAPGEYTTWWVLSNAELGNFLSLSYTFKVAGEVPTNTSVPPTATSQPTETSAPAATDTTES